MTIKACAPGYSGNSEIKQKKIRDDEKNIVCCVNGGLGAEWLSVGYWR